MIQEILQNSNRVDVFKLACQAMIDMDLRPMLPEMTAPTLVIGGDEDIMTPWQQAESGAGQEYLAQHIKGAKKHVIKGSGHRHCSTALRKIAVWSRPSLKESFDKADVRSQ